MRLSIPRIVGDDVLGGDDGSRCICVRQLQSRRGRERLHRQCVSTL